MYPCLLLFCFRGLYNGHVIYDKSDVKFYCIYNGMTHVSYLCPHYMRRLHVKSSFTFPKSPLYIQESHRLPLSAMYSFHHKSYICIYTKSPANIKLLGM